MLLLDNEQTELTAIEKGKHAYEHIDSFDEEGGRLEGGEYPKGGVSEYARVHGLKRQQADQWLKAYKVALACNNVAGLEENISYRILYEISKASEIAWQPLVEILLDEGWTVKQIVEHYL